MSQVTLKKTGTPRVGHYGAKARRMVTPASYDIFLNGVKVGELWGYCDTRLTDGGCGHKGKAFGVALSSPGIRGSARKNMESEIAELAARHQAQ